VNELFNQLVPYFAHRDEKTQTQIVRGYFTEEVGIQRRVLWLERADKDLFSIVQSNVAFEHGGHRLPRRQGCQCDINTGTVIDSKRPSVAPPSTNSRRREWP